MAVPRRLSRTEVEPVRVKLQVHQGHKCLLCGCTLKGKIRGGAALDHDHDTGFIRGVLCVVCNGGEGRIKAMAVRYGGGKEGCVQWLLNLAAYWKHHETPRFNFLHPTHLTDDEKRIATNLKAKKKRAKVKANGL